MNFCDKRMKFSLWSALVLKVETVHFSVCLSLEGTSTACVIEWRVFCVCWRLAPLMKHVQTRTVLTSENLISAFTWKLTRRKLSNSKNKKQKTGRLTAVQNWTPCVFASVYNLCILCVYCVCAVPVEVVAVLHVEQHWWDQFVHVLRLPDDGLQLIVHRLPHHTLQPFDPGHSDPDTDTETVRKKAPKHPQHGTSTTVKGCFILESVCQQRQKTKATQKRRFDLSNILIHWPDQALYRCHRDENSAPLSLAKRKEIEDLQWMALRSNRLMRWENILTCTTSHRGILKKKKKRKNSCRQTASENTTCTTDGVRHFVKAWTHLCRPTFF